MSSRLRYIGTMSRFVEPSSIRLVLDPAMDGAKRLNLWRDAFSLAGDISLADPDTLTGTFESKGLGMLRTIDVEATTFRIARDRKRGTMIPREHVIVNLVVSGRWSGRMAGRTIALGAGDVVLLRATSPLDLLLEDSRWLGLLIPRVAFEQRMHWSARLDGAVFPAASATAAMLGGHVRALCALPDRLPPRDTARVGAASLALLVACLGGTMPAAARDEDDREATARSIRRFIVERLGDPALDIDLLCTTFGLSRSALYRIMGENGDVASVIRRLRLQAIARDIDDPAERETPLPVIAARWGFPEARSFRRAFLREFGMSPSAMRENKVSVPSQGVVFAEFQRWFLGL